MHFHVWEEKFLPFSCLGCRDAEALSVIRHCLWLLDLYFLYYTNQIPKGEIRLSMKLLIFYPFLHRSVIQLSQNICYLRKLKLDRRHGIAWAIKSNCCQKTNIYQCIYHITVAYFHFKFLFFRWSFLWLKTFVPADRNSEHC